jgi:hypothetical protein
MKRFGSDLGAEKPCALDRNVHPDSTGIEDRTQHDPYALELGPDVDSPTTRDDLRMHFHNGVHTVGQITDQIF